MAVKIGAERSRLQQEHDTLRRLGGAGGSPHALDCGEVDQGGAPMFWFGMEHISGAPVIDHVRAAGRRGSPERVGQAETVARNLLSRLEELHQAGVLHCDLKSSNVLVEPDGGVRLIDFGSARRLSDGLCCGARFAGTFGCAPPEQLVGAFLDVRTDLFAVGVLLYRLLTDRFPFRGRSLTECLRELNDARPRSPTGPPALVQTIMESLSPRPERRPMSAEEALRRIS